MFDEEYQQEYYEEPDYETWEKNQLDLDKAMGEFDYDPEAYLYEPVEEFESDLWDDLDLGDST